MVEQWILEMQQQYKKQAKIADSRLRELERKAKSRKDTEYLRYAYSVAMDNIKTEIGGKRRFDRKPPDDPEDLRVWLSAVKRFNDSRTSTIRGFKNLNESRAEKFNKALGTDFSVSEFRKIMEYGAYDLLTESGAILFKYRTAVRILAALVKNNPDILDRKRKMTGKQMVRLLRKFKQSDDPELYDIIQDKLSGYDR